MLNKNNNKMNSRIRFKLETEKTLANNRIKFFDAVQIIENAKRDKDLFSFFDGEKDVKLFNDDQPGQIPGRHAISKWFDNYVEFFDSHPYFENHDIDKIKRASKVIYSSLLYDKLKCDDPDSYTSLMCEIIKEYEIKNGLKNGK